jgi:hypothetical protein
MNGRRSGAAWRSVTRTTRCDRTPSMRRSSEEIAVTFRSSLLPRRRTANRKSQVSSTSCGLNPDAAEEDRLEALYRLGASACTQWLELKSSAEEKRATASPVDFRPPYVRRFRLVYCQAPPERSTLMLRPASRGSPTLRTANSIVSGPFPVFRHRMKNFRLILLNVLYRRSRYEKLGK